MIIASTSCRSRLRGGHITLKVILHLIKLKFQPFRLIIALVGKFFEIFQMFVARLFCPARRSFVAQIRRYAELTQ